MRDDFLSADWARHHHDLSGGLHKLLAIVAASMERLHRAQFDAPWKHEPARR